MNIVLIEDDNNQADYFLHAISASLSGVSVVHFDSAYATLRGIEDLERNPPVFIVSDLMMRWRAIGDPEAEMPEDFPIERAGIYLLRQFRSTAALRSVPAIIWTAMETPQLGDIKSELGDVQLLNKAEFSVDDLVRRIRSLLVGRGIDLPSTRSPGKELADSVQLQPGAFGFAVDLKKVFSALKPKKKGR